MTEEYWWDITSVVITEGTTKYWFPDSSEQEHNHSCRLFCISDLVQKTVLFMVREEQPWHHHAGNIMLAAECRTWHLETEETSSHLSLSYFLVLLAALGLDGGVPVSRALSATCLVTDFLLLPKERRR